MMRPLLAAIIVMFVCAGAAGERVIIEGVEYELANGSAEIYHVNETQLPQDLVLPEAVQFNGVRYVVRKLRAESFTTSDGFLQSVTIPGTVTEIEENAFCTTGLKRINVEPNDVYLSVDGILFSRDMKVLYRCPDAYETSERYLMPDCVEEIASYALADCKFQGEMRDCFEMFDGLKKIGDFAFVSSNVVTVKMPDSVTTLGEGCFSSCKDLTSVKLSESLTELPDGCFDYCSRLASLVVPGSVTKLGDFCKRTTMDYMVIGKGVSSVTPGWLATAVVWQGKTQPDMQNAIYSFVNYVPNDSWDMKSKRVYKNLHNMFEVDGVVYFPTDNLTDRTCDVIYVDRDVETVNLGPTVTYEGVEMTVRNVNSFAFGGNQDRPANYNIVYFDNAGQVEDDMFGSKWNNVEQISVGANVTGIGWPGSDVLLKLLAFYVQDRDTDLSFGSKVNFSVSPLVHVYIGGNISYTGTASAFQNNATLSDLMFGEKVSQIQMNEFQNCSSLTTVFTGDNISSVGEGAFSGCSSLQHIELGTAVQSIGAGAFADCGNVEYLASCNSVPPVCEAGVFDDINVWKCTLHVPGGALEAYKAADEWKNFYKMTDDMPVSVKVEAINFAEEEVQVMEGGGMMLEVTVLPENASLKKLNWKSTDTAIATVDENGVVRGVHYGECNIIATAVDGSGVRAVCHVIVNINTGVDDVFGDDAAVEVYTVTGVLVGKGADVDLSSLAHGVYIIRTADGRTRKVAL